MHWLLRALGGSFALGVLAVSASCGSSTDTKGPPSNQPGGASSAGTSAGGQASGLGGETSAPVGGAVMPTEGGTTSSAAAAGAGVAGNAGEASGGAGTVDPCPQGGCFQSCSGLTGSECQGESCCETLPVEGGTFEQGEPDAFSSTVDAYALDKYEVSVARFRNFVNAYDAWLNEEAPRPGAGANAHVPGSGWQAAWNASLAPDAATLKSKLACGHGNDTWAEAGNDALPITCVDWYTAFAFCIWDGGRLPTDTEAEYAAVGGSRDYRYPWGDAPILTDQQDESAAYAVYHCLADGVAGCTAGDLLPVGSKPAGKGHFQQLDLVGSVWEWALDGWQENYPTSAQTNYAKLDAEKFRTMRGGCWDSTAKLAHGASRTGLTPTTNYDQVGIRCARNL
ncbi:MAG TPA: SUMF1/EgtB/PvdO family nonheme iron enzyme [Polyangiaceae bacterium]|nr:SUMF1/EgtB/PvdO family nonheme iron enzyme [Polyangiaceae bacterium]